MTLVVERFGEALRGLRWEFGTDRLRHLAGAVTCPDARTVRLPDDILFRDMVFRVAEHLAGLGWAAREGLLYSPPGWGER